MSASSALTAERARVRSALVADLRRMVATGEQLPPRSQVAEALQVFCGVAGDAVASILDPLYLESARRIAAEEEAGIEAWRGREALRRGDGLEASLHCGNAHWLRGSARGIR